MCHALIRLLLVIASLLLANAPASAQKRVALVIGNAGYTSIARLKNPVNDATLMAETLKGVGFEVITASDVDFRGMRKAVGEFGRRLRAAGRDAVGLFYYSGHGVQSRGQNYLIPLKAEIASAYDFDIEAMSASDVLGQMESAGNRLNIVILDACRDNPFSTGTKSLSKGFARMSAPSGSLIAFATAPGRTAADGDGRNSPYTAALAQALKVPGLSVEQVFKRVRVAVEDSTARQQTPWEQSSLRGDFYFVPGARPNGGQTGSSLETDFDLARSIGTRAAWESFLAIHGSKTGNPRVKLARAALQKLAVGVFPKPEPVPAKPKCNGVLTTVAGEKKCLKHGDTFRDCPDCPEMVVIPPGSSVVGSPKSEKDRGFTDWTQRNVTIRQPFAVGRFEVTVGQFELFVKRTGYKPSERCWMLLRESVIRKRRGSFRSPGYTVSNSHPATCLNWHEVNAYLDWLKGQTGQAYRLLTELEWEYAARSGSTGRFPRDDNDRKICKYANFADQSLFGSGYNRKCRDGVGKGTAKVGSYRANAFGLSDMHGNAWEWVNDCWSPGDCNTRTIRGGSWRQPIHWIRSATRAGSPVIDGSDELGFRVARDLEQ